MIFDKGFFGDLFDLNGDGHLDDLERAADFSTFMCILEEEEKKTEAEKGNSREQEERKNDE